MSHVTEKLAEFIFEELPAAEMTAARRHVSECANCRDQVDRFQQTLSLLQATPQLEPTRNIVFEFARPVVSRFWRWFPAATAVAALILMTVALAGRVHVQWHDSQLTIAFGETIPAAPPDQTAEIAAELQRVKGHLAYLQNRQQAVERETVVIAARIPPVVRSQRSTSGD